MIYYFFFNVGPTQAYMSQKMAYSRHFAPYPATSRHVQSIPAMMSSFHDVHIVHIVHNVHTMNNAHNLNNVYILRSEKTPKY